MGWLFYSLTTVALFALWSLLGKVALRTATPVQTTLLYGVAAAVVAVAAIAIGQRTAAWSVGTLWVGVLSAVCGALGLLTFYLALDRGSASLAVPVIGFYPAVVAVAAVVFLGEKMSVLQVLGVALAVAGVALIGAAAELGRGGGRVAALGARLGGRGRPSSSRSSSGSCSTSTFQAWRNPLMANAISRICSGTISAVSRPSRLSSSVRAREAGLVAVEPLRRGDGREDQHDDRQRAGDRQHAAAPAHHEERHHEVEHDVGDLQRLGALERLPAAPRDDRQQDGRGQQQEHHDQPRDLRGRLLAVRMLDPDVALFVGHCVRDLTISGLDARRMARAGVAELVDARGLGPRGRKPWGFESLRPHG